MNIPNPHIENISHVVPLLVGKNTTDAALQAFLQSVNAWPVREFPADEFNVFFEDKERGFCLEFRDATTVKSPIVTEKIWRMPVFTGCFFYIQGKDGYQQFNQALPHQILWGDTPDLLLAKLGPTKFTITNKKTGILSAYRWEINGLKLGTSFTREGTIDHVYFGL
jgi:hypothetical protein